MSHRIVLTRLQEVEKEVETDISAFAWNLLRSFPAFLGLVKVLFVGGVRFLKERGECSKDERWKGVI